MQTLTTQTLSAEEPGESDPASGGSNWPMHARGVGEMLDLSVDLFVACIVPTVGLAFLMWLPVRIVWVSLGDGGEGAQLLRLFFNLVGGALVQTLSVALVIQVVYAELQGRRVTLRQPLIVALKRAPALIVCTMIISLATSIGLVCMFFPGIFLMFIWSVAPAALVLEGSGPIECLGRSRRLVRNGILRWAGVMLCAYALKSPYDVAAVMLDQPLVMDWAIDDLHVPVLAYSLAQVFLTSLLLAISTAALSIVVTVFYLDCRVRGEGFDLAMRLERLQHAELARRAK